MPFNMAGVYVARPEEYPPDVLPSVCWVDIPKVEYMRRLGYFVRSFPGEGLALLERPSYVTRRDLDQVVFVDDLPERFKSREDLTSQLPVDILITGEGSNLVSQITQFKASQLEDGSYIYEKVTYTISGDMESDKRLSEGISGKLNYRRDVDVSKLLLGSKGSGDLVFKSDSEVQGLIDDEGIIYQDSGNVAGAGYVSEYQDSGALLFQGRVIVKGLSPNTGLGAYNYYDSTYDDETHLSMSGMSPLYVPNPYNYSARVMHDVKYIRTKEGLWIKLESTPVLDVDIDSGDKIPGFDNMLEIFKSNNNMWLRPYHRRFAWFSAVPDPEDEYSVGMYYFFGIDRYGFKYNDDRLSVLNALGRDLMVKGDRNLYTASYDYYDDPSGVSYEYAVVDGGSYIRVDNSELVDKDPYLKRRFYLDLRDVKMKLDDMELRLSEVEGKVSDMEEDMGIVGDKLGETNQILSEGKDKFVDLVDNKMSPLWGDRGILSDGKGVVNAFVDAASEYAFGLEEVDASDVHEQMLSRDEDQLSEHMFDKMDWSGQE